MNTKAFKKGQEVTLIQSWDNKGTFSFRHAIVYSCGAKQMVLTDALSGEEIGRHFAPQTAKELTYFNWLGVYPRLTDDEAAALCLSLGAALPAVVEVENNRRRAWNEKQGSVVCLMIQDELHEPRWIKREGKGTV